MEDSYLFQVLKALKTTEIEALREFVDSTFFNRGNYHGEARALLALATKTADIETVSAMPKDTLYQYLFPGQPPVKGKLEKVMSELNKLVRAFLLWQKFQDPGNEFEYLFNWAVILRERGLTTRYEQAISRISKFQEDTPFKESVFFHRQFRLEYEMHDWQSLFNRKKGDLNIPETLFHLDIHYYLNRLELLNRFLLQSRATYLEIPDLLRAALEETRLPERYLQESHILLITYKIHLILKEQHPTPAEFEALRQLLLDHEMEVSPSLLRQFYAYLRSLCVILLNAGSSDMWPILHHLQQDNLRRGYLYYDNYLPPGAFLSVTTTGLRVKNFEWVRQFIESHGDMILGDNESRDYYRLGLAYYYFETGQFEKALDCVPANPQETDYLLKARRLELMIYYELNSELLPYKIDAYKMFISRASNKLIPEQIKEFNTNFVNLLLQIVASTPGDKGRSERLVQRIRSKSNVSEQEWLLKKAFAIA